MKPATVHATAVLLGERGILIRGASGTGKSSVALALLDSDPARARLVADDRVALVAAHGRIVAYAVPELAGLLEIRGQGIARYPHISPVRIDLVADLVPPAELARLPSRDETRVSIETVVLPRIFLAIGDASAASRIRAAFGDFAAA